LSNTTLFNGICTRQYWIIGGHFDCVSDSSLIYAPGADDNASGTVAAILASKYLNPYPFKYTVKFIGWNNEEGGAVGSAYHAWLARTRGDSILGVLNGDMIATEFTGNDSIRVYTSSRPGSIAIGDTFFTVNQRYNIGLQVRRDTFSDRGSDHYSYWENGYEAIFINEDDFSPHYHRTTDRIIAPEFDTIFLTNVIKAMVATIATLAQPDTQINFISERLTSNSEFLIQAAPNPFQKNTTVYYNIEKGKDVIISIFSTEGRLVKRFYQNFQSEGLSSFTWDGENMDGNKIEGIYFLYLKEGNKTFSYKLTLLK
jgi:hypothetical protein